MPADRWSQPLIGRATVDEWLGGGGVGDRWPKPVDVREVRTNLSDNFLRWRFGTPILDYRVDDGRSAVIVRKRAGSALELAVVSGFGEPAASMPSPRGDCAEGRPHAATASAARVSDGCGRRSPVAVPCSHGGT